MDYRRDFDDVVLESGRRQNNTIIMVKSESARLGGYSAELSVNHAT